MKKIALTIFIILGGSSLALASNGRQARPKPAPMVKAPKLLHKSKGSSRLPLRSKYSHNYSGHKNFTIPIKRKIHHGEVQASVGYSTVLKRKGTHGEVQAKQGFTTPLKRKEASGS